MGNPYDDGRFIEGIAIDWDAVDPHSYERRIPALRALERLDFDEPVPFLVGENGTGKSTLLEALAVAYGFNAEGGTLNYRFSTYDDVSDLGDAMRVGRGRGKTQSSYFFRAESFFNVATKAREYGGSVPRSAVLTHLHERSHGESFLAFFQAFGDPGLYLMDEPEAALSPQRQLTLPGQLHDRSRHGSQFVIATHSPILLGLPGAAILDFDGGAIRPCAYEDTASYRVTELFVNHHEAVLRHLLDE